VDDYTYLPQVRQAVDDWVEINKAVVKNTYFLNSFRGTFVIEL